MVAATNRDLQKMVEAGKFREDLWYRLNVVRIVLPPLVERRGDVPLLAHYFLKKYNERYGQQARLTESGLRALENYSWPGNVRQLQHMMERLTILAPQGKIDDAAVREAIELTEPRDNCERDAGRYRGRSDPPRAVRDRRQQEPRGEDPGHRAEDALSQAGADGIVGVSFSAPSVLN